MSIILHTLLFAMVLIEIPSLRAKPSPVTLEAKLMFKKKPSKENLLPKKVLIKEKKENEHKVNTPKAASAKKPLPKVVKKELKREPKKTDFSNKLLRLSESFSEDLVVALDAKENDMAIENDGNYFDQIYSFIKSSFVVPPHLNGPRGYSLQALLRIFIAADGALIKVVLEKSSNDEHFDKAILDGAHRVNNFGPVPLFLQESLQNQGVIVEMCPFKCLEKQGF